MVIRTTIKLDMPMKIHRDIAWIRGLKPTFLMLLIDRLAPMAKRTKTKAFFAISTMLLYIGRVNSIIETGV